MKINCAHDELVEIHKLQPNPKNPNKHPDKQIELLAKIIDYQGQRSPIVVSTRSGFITKGHGRVEAIKNLGWDKCAVDYQDYDNEAQEYADMVADNKIAELAEHDDAFMIDTISNMDLSDLPSLDMLGMPDFELPKIAEPQCDEDEVPEQVEPKTKLGDIYKIGNHRMMCGDSTSIDAVEKLIANEEIELCFTSPPYSDQREYNGNKELSTEYLAKFITASFDKVKLYAVNLGYSRKNGEVFEYWNDYINEARSCGLKLLSWNIWDKGEAGSIGNQTAMFAIQHEWIFVFGGRVKDLNLTVKNKDTGKLRHGTIRNKDGSTTAVKNKTDKVRTYSQLKTVYHCTPQKARDDIKHPARFPVEFPEGYILACTDVGECVYEPFGGSGSTLIACEKTNRKCFMMEIDPYYCDIIVARWEKYTGKKAELLNG